MKKMLAILAGAALLTSPLAIPTTALAQAVTFDDSTMHVQLTDGRTMSVPLLWFPRLLAAQPEQRAQVAIGGGGRGLHWDERVRMMIWWANYLDELRAVSSR